MKTLQSRQMFLKESNAKNLALAE